MSKFSAEEYAKVKERLARLQSANSSGPPVVPPACTAPAPSTPAPAPVVAGGHATPAPTRPASTPPSRPSLDTTPEFTTKVHDLREELLSIFNRFGIKYSVDAQVTSRLQELSSLYVQATSSLRAQLRDTSTIQDTYEQRIAAVEEATAETVRVMRQEEAERTRKTKQQTTRMQRVELKKLRDKIEHEYLDAYGIGPPGSDPPDLHGMPLSRAELRFQAKYKRAWEEEWRQEAALQGPSQASQSRDAELEQKLQKLQQQAVEAVAKKDTELTCFRSKYQQAVLALTAYKEAHGKLEAQLGALKAANTGLRLQQIEKDSEIQKQTGRLHAASEQAQGATRRFQTMVQESKRLESELRARIRIVETQAEKQSEKVGGSEAKVRALKDRHEAELDALNSRIRRVLKQKDSLVEAKQKEILQQQQKLDNFERYLHQQQDDLLQL